MQTIMIKEITKEAASQSSGEKLLNIMEPLIRDNIEFCVDFNELTRFASPFFNNSFAKLALIYGFETIDSIERLNLSTVGTNTNNTSMENAKLLSKDSKYVAKIEEYRYSFSFPRLKNEYCNVANI